MHDTIEDTAVTLGDIASDFGSNVAELVHSVTKPCPGTEAPAMEIASYYARRRTVHRVAESERRILVVKIADRLHNMFTLGALGSWKRQTYSQETMRVFVPVARAFGLVGAELELSRLAAVYA
ncbi:MAG: hypothetical protein AMS25_12090 [Gemmatimonas sp. SM23_52]|nr:MAG: hypothetical protein AMS25_12090 [Gemmatimonas sp. SM23_52]